MTASVDLLRILVTIATVGATAAPLLLAVLFVRDALRGKIW